MSEELINKVLAEVVKQVGTQPVAAPAPSAATPPTVGNTPAAPEFVGTNVLGDTIGQQDPEYGGTREIPLESARTIWQG